jgi:hypothetical protein
MEAGVPKTGRRKSRPSRPEARHQATKAKDCQAAFRFRPLGNRDLEYSLRFFVLLRSKLCVGQSLAYDLRAEQAESVRVGNLLFLRGAIIKQRLTVVGELASELI